MLLLTGAGCLFSLRKEACVGPGIDDQIYSCRSAVVESVCVYMSSSQVHPESTGGPGFLRKEP